MAHWSVVALAYIACVSASSFDTTDWHQYVRGPSSKTISPTSVLKGNTTGNVSNPDGFLTGNAVTTLSRTSSGDTVPSIVVDFGRNVVGTLKIKFAGSKNGTLGYPGIEIAFSETQQFLSNRSDFTRSDNGSGNDRLTPGTDQVAVKNEPYVWEDTHGCEYFSGQGKVCRDGLHGFRYLRISLNAYDGDQPWVSPDGSVSIESMSLDWGGYLGTTDTYTGWFECSDPDLSQWWYDGVYTTDMGTAPFIANETDPRGASSPSLEGKQVIFDGAKRDRDPYVGDLAVASRTSYLSHDFAEASKNVLVDLANHQRSDGWIPPASINNYDLHLFDYPLWWVVSGVDLVMYTGDTDYASTYWANIVNVLDKYYPQYIDSSTGMLTKDDSLGYGDYAFLPRSGPVTYYNALYIHALRYTASLAKSLGGHDEDASRWTERASSLSAALLKHNLDPEAGAFYDGGPCPNQPAGTVCPVHAQDGNSLAILANVTDSKQSKSILDYYGSKTSRPYGNAFYDSNTLGDGFADRVYAFISYFEIAARFETAGQEKSAFDEIRRLYGWMATHDPKITHWEGIGEKGEPYEGPFTSMAHGWSTGIVPLMSNYVLGVTPRAPGFSKWTICPVTTGGDLTWAKGVVPTPRGPVKVSWRVCNGGSLAIKVEAPEDTEGTICVDKTSHGLVSVRLNGKDVTNDKTIVHHK